MTDKSDHDTNNNIPFESLSLTSSKGEHNP